MALAVIAKLDEDFELHRASYYQLPIEELVKRSYNQRIAPNRPEDLSKWKAVWNYLETKKWVKNGMSPERIRENLNLHKKQNIYFGPVFSVETIKQIILSGSGGNFPKTSRKGGARCVQQGHDIHTVAGYLQPNCTRSAPQYGARNGDLKYVIWGR